MSTKSFFTVLAALLLVTVPVQAGAIPGRWELVDSLESGTPIIIRLKAGERMECSFRESSQKAITYIDDSGNERTVPKNEIQKIESSEKTGDSLKNGIGYGALIGAGSAILALTAYAKSVTASGPIIDSETAGIFLGAGLVGAGIGALAGLGVDASIKGRKVLYQSR